MITIPQGWEYKPIEKLISLVMDFRGKTPLKIGMEWGNGKISSLSANNVQMGKIDFTKDNHLGSEALYEAWMNKGATKKDDIVFTMEAPLGNVALIPDNQKYILSQRVVLLRANSKILPHYFFDYLMSGTFQSEVLKYASGSTVKGIQYSKLKEIGILYPIEGKEQQKIAEILSGIDRAIEVTQTLIGKEKMIKKGLMADLLNHGIDEQGHIRTPQTHRYIESPLGMIPEGWEPCNFSHLVSNKTKKADTTTMLPIIDLEHIEQDNGKLIPNSWENDYPKDKVKFSKNDILFGKLRPYLKKYWFCLFEGACTSELIVMQAKKGIDPKFVYYVVHNERFLAHADRYSYGTKMPRVSFEDLKSYVLAIPIKIDEQQRIAQILSAQDRKIETEEANLAKLQHLKKGLMNDLLSGKVRVK